MVNETCPNCGAEQMDFPHYKEGKVYYACFSVSSYRTQDCMLRQLDKHEALIQQLRKELEARGEVK